MDHRISKLAAPALLAALPGLLGFAGCGVAVDGARWEEELHVAADADLLPARYVVLDWAPDTGLMFPDAPAPAIDLSLFDVADGTTLANVPEFPDQVAARMQEIFDDLIPADVRVEPIDAKTVTPAARVLMTQLSDPHDPRRVGQAYYDPCDQRMGDEAVLWGQAMIELGNGHTLEQWINLFANTAAHEVAHTLGFAHPDVTELDSGRPWPSEEIMLASHSLESLLQPQRFLIEQDTCPLSEGDFPLGSYTLQTASADSIDDAGTSAVQDLPFGR